MAVVAGGVAADSGAGDPAGGDWRGMLEFQQALETLYLRSAGKICCATSPWWRRGGLSGSRQSGGVGGARPRPKESVGVRRCAGLTHRRGFVLTS